MGKKNRGPVPCTLCDSSFASIANLEQVGGLLVSPRQFADLSSQHARDKGHRSTPTQVLPVRAQPPTQQPRVEVRTELVPVVRMPRFIWLNAESRVSPSLRPPPTRQYASTVLFLSLHQKTSNGFEIPYLFRPPIVLTLE